MDEELIAFILNRVRNIQPREMVEDIAFSSELFTTIMQGKLPERGVGGESVGLQVIKMEFEREMGA